jgi:hypothetical protein
MYFKTVEAEMVRCDSVQGEGCTLRVAEVSRRHHKTIARGGGVRKMDLYFTSSFPTSSSRPGLHRTIHRYTACGSDPSAFQFKKCNYRRSPSHF